jgi:hypothetical protein
MVTDQAVHNERRIQTDSEDNPRGGRWSWAPDRGWRRPVVVLAALTAGGAFVGWVAVLALTLPSQYAASHWNVAWVGFDVMLLVSLVLAGWAVVMRRHWASTALMVSAVLLVCDTWFDVTTTSGPTDTLVSVGLAIVALPAAAGLAWAAIRMAAGGRRS